MSKHTPGPWVVRESLGRTWVELAGHDSDGEGRLIQITGSGGARSFTQIVVEPQIHDDNDANAHLIAAAPEMLDALKEVKRLFEYRGDDATTFATKVEAEIVAAIAKAEGRS